MVAHRQFPSPASRSTISCNFQKSAIYLFRIPEARLDVRTPVDRTDRPRPLARSRERRRRKITARQRRHREEPAGRPGDPGAVGRPTFPWIATPRTGNRGSLAMTMENLCRASPLELPAEPKVSASSWKVSIREPNRAFASLREAGRRMMRRQGKAPRSNGAAARPTFILRLRGGARRRSVNAVIARSRQGDVAIQGPSDALPSRGSPPPGLGFRGSLATTMENPCRSALSSGVADGTERRRNPLKSPDSGAKACLPLALQKGTQRSAPPFPLSRRTPGEKR
jgi:hypothetical protein